MGNRKLVIIIIMWLLLLLLLLLLLNSVKPIKVDPLRNSAPVFETET